MIFVTHASSTATKTKLKPKKRDGRTLRGERSRNACARAMLELIREGHLQPTAAAVAERAGVSLRLVFHHFKDMEAVMRHAMQLQAERIAPMTPITIPEGASLEEKLTIFVDRRAALYEEISPVRRAGRHLEPNSSSIADALKRVRTMGRDQLEFLFRDEIETIADKPPRIAAAHVATNWLAWEALRTHQGLDVDAAKQAMKHGLRVLLTC